jgi:hypothetical protein
MQAPPRRGVAGNKQAHLGSHRLSLGDRQAFGILGVGSQGEQGDQNNGRRESIPAGP